MNEEPKYKLGLAEYLLLILLPGYFYEASQVKKSVLFVIAGVLSFVLVLITVFVFTLDTDLNYGLNIAFIVVFIWAVVNFLLTHVGN